MTFDYTKNNNGEFVCPHCPQTKKNQNTMHYHLKKHAGNLEHACKDCDAKFLHSVQLKNHILSKHTNTDTVRKLKCPHPDCTFETLTKSNRLIHYLRKHCEEEVKNIMRMTRGDNATSYTCTVCNDVCVSNTSFCYHAKGCMQITDAARQREMASII